MKLIAMSESSFSIIAEDVNVEGTIAVTQTDYEGLVEGTKCFNESLTAVIENVNYIPPEPEPETDILITENEEEELC